MGGQSLIDIGRWIRHNYFSKREIFAGALRNLVVYLTTSGDIQLPSGRNIFIGGRTDESEGGFRLHYNGTNAYMDVVDGSLIIRVDTTSGGTQVAEISPTRITVDNQLGTAWSGLTFNAGWANYESGWTTGQVKKVGDLVFVTGLVYRFTGAETVIATLPVGSRPVNSIMFHCISNDLVCRVDVNSDGEIEYNSGGAPGTWIWFNHWFSTHA